VSCQTDESEQGEAINSKQSLTREMTLSQASEVLQGNSCLLRDWEEFAAIQEAGNSCWTENKPARIWWGP